MIMEKSEKRTVKKPRRITESYLHNAGLFYLQRYTASSTHFKKVMARKVERSCRFHEDQDRDRCLAMVDELVEKFKSLGLLNDHAYLTGMITSLRRRGMSTRAIFARLRAKGLSGPEIEEALTRYDDDLPEDAELISALRHVRRKKIGPYASPDADSDLAYKAMQKNMASMARAGFSYDIIQKVLDMPQEEADKILIAAE